MNFLAHLYLSKRADDLMIGNFIGDAVKGNNFNNYSEGIAHGIIMHRSIDSYTDAHPVVHQSKMRLVPRYKKYAGVLVDVFYDHFLASNWNQYHQTPLLEFADKVYKLMQDNIQILPAKSREMLPYMIKYNWLFNYSKIEGIKRTLTGMANRTNFISNMEYATEELEYFYDDFQKEFEMFFADAIKQFKSY